MAVFSAVDYVIFGAFLCISVVIGIYHACKARKASSDATAEFLMGGRKMPVLPVSLSLLTTFLSGVTMLGTPAEIYQRGLLFWLYYLIAGFALLFSGIFFIPIIYFFKPTSIYEYFERRFGSRMLRRVAAAIFLIYGVFYMAVVLYAPAVALSGVTQLPTWPFILIVGCCCTLYTTIGGLKAVVWTDTIQAIFMYAGTGVLIVKGTIDAGGIKHVFEYAADTQRVAALKRIDFNPAQHNSVWISIFGAFGFWMVQYGLNQMALQRYCSLRSLNDARKVVAITIPCYIVLGSMACYIGVLMLAYFQKHGGDPLQRKVISSPDQLVIYFATDVLGVNGVPGLPGLFLACLFSSTLSTVSSGMNSMAAVTWEDFLKDTLGHRLSGSGAAMVNKGLVLTYGTLGLCLAFLAGPMGGIIKSSFVIMGAISGPLIGLFFVGVFNPLANKYGVLLAVLIASAVNIWLAIGNIVDKPYGGYVLPLPTPGNITTTQPPFDPHYGHPDVIYPYRISGFLYPLMGILMVCILGSVFSLFFKEDEATRKNKLTLTVCGAKYRKVPLVNGDGEVVSRV